jgi:P-type Cu2+ transporter
MIMATYYFSLPGITCVNCVRPIEYQLKRCGNIKNYAVDLVDKTLTVTVEDDKLSALAVRQLVHTLLDEIGVEYKDITPAPHWALGIAGTIAGLALLAVMLLMSPLPLIALISIASLAIPLTLILGWTSYKDAAKKLFKARTLTMDTLFAISTLTVIAVSVAAFFFPWLPMMFDAGLLIFGFRHIGLGIEDSIKQKMGLSAKFQHRLPKEVVIEGGVEKKSLDTIKVNDILLIKPGEIIPVDAIYDGDESAIFDTIVTGSTLPRRVVKGEQLLAGMSVALDGKPLRIRVTAATEDSYLSRLDKNIAQANLEKSPIETATNKVLQYFIPGVIILAIIAALVIGNFFSIALAVQCATTILVSACPCTLGFITPLAVRIGMNKGAEHGVRFKSAKTLQEAEQMDRIVFDLNGTLTIGIPTVVEHKVAPDAALSLDDLLAYFAAIEQSSEHPIAKSICEFVTKRPIVAPAAWVIEDQQSHPSGRTAKINGQLYTVGNQSMMDASGIDTTALPCAEHLKAGESIIYLAQDKKVMGYLILEDKLRPDAKHVVATLQSMGKGLYICTGADAATANRYAAMLGIAPEHVCADCVGSVTGGSRRDKKTFIRQLQQKREDDSEQKYRVAMVGDAANDAEAIATSDFGIAVQSLHGDEVTQQQAGAIIQSGSLLPVASTFAIAKQTVSNIKQNLWMSLGYNAAVVLVVGGLLLAVGMTLNPGIGVALMILQTSLILYSAYRFKQQKLAHLQHAPAMEGASGDSYSYLVANMLSKEHEPKPDDTHEAEAFKGDAFSPLPSSVTLPARRGLPARANELAQERGILRASGGR